FWDPVENASFMPWLAGTALIHSLAVTEKRGTFRSWTVLLAIIAFSLSLVGTFLVRSGVLTSVHAFATDPARGVFILAFLPMGIGPLAAWRKAELPDLATRLKWALAVAIIIAVVLPFVLGRWTPLIALGVLLSAWLAASTVVALVQRVRGSPQRGLAAKLRAN